VQTENGSVKKIGYMRVKRNICLPPETQCPKAVRKKDHGIKFPGGNRDVTLPNKRGKRNRETRGNSGIEEKRDGSGKTYGEKREGKKERL